MSEILHRTYRVHHCKVLMLGKKFFVNNASHTIVSHAWKGSTVYPLVRWIPTSAANVLVVAARPEPAVSFVPIFASGCKSIQLAD